MALGVELRVIVLSFLLCFATIGWMTGQAFWAHRNLCHFYATEQVVQETDELANSIFRGKIALKLRQ